MRRQNQGGCVASASLLIEQAETVGGSPDALRFTRQFARRALPHNPQLAARSLSTDPVKLWRSTLDRSDLRRAIVLPRETGRNRDAPTVATMSGTADAASR
jgi:hypothetical protein